MEQPLYLFNTLSKKKEVFIPISKNLVTMYNCGPTVYHYAHIGNLRSYIFADILKRTLNYNGYEVKQVINITDLGHLSSDADDGEDKMTKGLKREGKPLTLESMKELAEFYAKAFFNDLKAENINVAEIIFPRASENIPEQIEIIKKLHAKGFIYHTSDGLYFETNLDPSYGKLGNVKNEKTENEQSRIGLNQEKRNPRDFAVWKFNKKLGWETPWGKGFPGWHIECSAMAMKYLGETLDIHTGGIDHIDIHHNNEIAQSEQVTGKPFARYWLHNSFINLTSGKMSKSEDGFITLSTVIKKNINPLALRYLILSATYRTTLDFSWASLESSMTTLIRLYRHFSALGKNTGKTSAIYRQKFLRAVNDDLNTPQATALMWDMLKDASLSDQDKKATLIDFDLLLGLDIQNQAKMISHNDTNIPEEIQTLLKKREEARNNKDWKKSDEFRLEIEGKGYEVIDSQEGVRVRKI